MKPCPFCAEEIQDAAIKCRYCGELLDTSVAAPAAVESIPTQGPAPLVRANPAATASVNEPSPPRCPRCDSTHLSAGDKGFGVGKAAAGGLLLGPIGLAAGAIGSKSVRLACMSCGHAWDPRNLGLVDSIAVAAKQAQELNGLPEDHPRRKKAESDNTVQMWASLITVIVFLIIFIRFCA